jgi:hypothetical protein
MIHTALKCDNGWPTYTYFMSMYVAVSGGTAILYLKMFHCIWYRLNFIRSFVVVAPIFCRKLHYICCKTC